MLSDIVKIRLIVKEIHSYAVTTRSTQLHELLDDVFRRAKYVDIAAEHPFMALVSRPRMLIPLFSCAQKGIDRHGILACIDRLHDLLDLVLRIAADHMGIDHRAHLAVYRCRQRLYLFVVRPRGTSVYPTLTHPVARVQGQDGSTARRVGRSPWQADTGAHGQVRSPTIGVVD